MGERRPFAVIRRAIVGAVVLLSLEPMSGCLVVRAAVGEPGTDLSSIRPRASRAEVERVLGAPVRGWSTENGVRYELYRYDRGAPPDKTDAAAALLLDVMTGFVMFEPMAALGLLPLQHEGGLVAVSFDQEDLVLGAFPDVTEFSILPADDRSIEGRAPGRKV